MILLALSLAAAPVPAFRWGDQGHRVLCEIAYRRLTPEARAWVDGIRRADPDSSDSFAGSCVWADNVRGNTHPFTSAYHYVNIPTGAPGTDPERDCGDAARRCVGWAIGHYTAVLVNPDATPLGRAEALKFVSHFVGDLHQPLHAGRPDDLGGNRVLVDFFGERRSGGDSLNLHGIWDYSILQRAGISWPRSVTELNAGITPAQARTWAALNVIDWMDESYRLAESMVYRLPAGKRIDEAYFRRAVEASRLRLMQAGVRLAHLLNQIAAGTFRLETLVLP
jgi:hypothetical protein